MTDFDVLYPHQAQFLRQLSAVVSQRRLIEADTSLTDDSKRGKIRQLTLGDSSTTIDDIGSVFLATFFLSDEQHFAQNNYTGLAKEVYIFNIPYLWNNSDKMTWFSPKCSEKS